MKNYKDIIDFFELEKKYTDPKDRGRMRKYLTSSFNALFNDTHANNVKFENNRISPGEITSGMESVLNFLNQFKDKFKNLRKDEELWTIDHLDFLFTSYSKDTLEPNKNLNLNYSNKTVIFSAGRDEHIDTDAVPVGINLAAADSPILLKIIEDYATVLEERINEQKEKTSSTNYIRGTLAKQLLAGRLRQYWFNHAYKPGKGKFSTGNSRFNSYIELGFNLANEECPSRNTLNKYFDKG